MRIQVKQKWREDSIVNPEHVANIVRAILAAEDEYDQAKEHIWVFGLDSRNRVKYIDLVHLGSANACMGCPREIFRRAVAGSAVSIVLAHNHPSGDPSPSKDDMNLTARIVGAGEILDIRLLDHVIVGDKTYESFQEHGLI